MIKSIIEKILDQWHTFYIETISEKRTRRRSSLVPLKLKIEQGRRVKRLRRENSLETKEEIILKESEGLKETANSRRKNIKGNLTKESEHIKKETANLGRKNIKGNLEKETRNLTKSNLKESTLKESEEKIKEAANIKTKNVKNLPIKESANIRRKKAGNEPEKLKENSLKESEGNIKSLNSKIKSVKQENSNKESNKKELKKVKTENEKNERVKLRKDDVSENISKEDENIKKEIIKQVNTNTRKKNINNENKSIKKDSKEKEIIQATNTRRKKLNENEISKAETENLRKENFKNIKKKVNKKNVKNEISKPETENLRKENVNENIKNEETSKEDKIIKNEEIIEIINEDIIIKNNTKKSVVQRRKRYNDHFKSTEDDEKPLPQVQNEINAEMPPGEELEHQVSKVSKTLIKGNFSIPEIINKEATVTKNEEDLVADQIKSKPKKTIKTRKKGITMNAKKRNRQKTTMSNINEKLRVIKLGRRKSEENIVKENMIKEKEEDIIKEKEEGINLEKDIILDKETSANPILNEKENKPVDVNVVKEDKPLDENIVNDKIVNDNMQVVKNIVKENKPAETRLVNVDNIVNDEIRPADCLTVKIVKKEEDPTNLVNDPPQKLNLKARNDLLKSIFKKEKNKIEIKRNSVFVDDKVKPQSSKDLEINIKKIMKNLDSPNLRLSPEKNKVYDVKSSRFLRDPSIIKNDLYRRVIDSQRKCLSQNDYKSSTIIPHIKSDEEDSVLFIEPEYCKDSGLNDKVCQQRHEILEKYFNLCDDINVAEIFPNIKDISNDSPNKWN